MGLKASKQKADITTPSKEKKVKRRKSKKESVTANGDTGIEEVGIQEKKDDSVILPEAQPTNGEVKSPEVENKEKGDAEKKAETDSAGSGDAPTDIVEDSPDKETNQVAQLSDVKSPTEPPPPVAATEPSTAEKSDAAQPSPVEETKSEQVSSPSEVKPEEPKSEPVVAASEAKPDSITVTPPTPEVTRPELASSSISDVKSEPTTTPVQGKSETVSSAASEQTKSEPETAVGAKPEPVPEPAVATPEEVKSEPVATPSEVKPEAVAAVPEAKKSEEVAAAEPTATSEETKQEPVVEPIVPAKQEEKPEPVATTPEEIKPEPAVEPPVTTPEETKPEPKSETAVSMPEETKQEPVTESPVTPEETNQESVIEPAVATSEETKQELVTEPVAAATPEEVKSEPVAEQPVSTPEEPKPEAAAAVSDVASEHTPVETKTESPVDKKEEPKQLPETPELERLEQETSQSAEKSDVQVNGVTETVQDSATHKEMATEEVTVNGQVPESSPAEIATLISWKHGGQEVAVCGDFNKWEDNCTLIEQDGIFSTKIKLTKGQHHLKFLVDGKWTVDENEPVAELEGHGQVNVLTVS